MKQPTNSQWVYVPPLEDPRFVGFQTDADPTQVAYTGHVNGQNTFVNEGDRISTRPFGLTLVPEGTTSVAAGGIKSQWTFRKRDGEKILIRAYGTDMEWLDETSGAWVNLRSGLSSDDFGFAHFNVNTDQESRAYMGNGEDNMAYWSGFHTNLTSATTSGDATVNVTSTASFPATGTFRLDGSNVTYTGKTATTFTGCSGTPTSANGTAVAQAVVEDASAPKGKILMSANNRLFIVPEVNPQLVQFSAYGDAATWLTTTVTSSTATAAGAFNLIEGGGRVNAMVQDEQSLYFIKDSCIYSATLTDALYALQMLKPFDDRARATGATGRRSVFVGGNIIFLVSPDNQIYALQRLADVNYPQLKPISDPIQPTCDSLDFSEMVGISFRERAYFACKQNADDATNNTVLVYNIRRGHWESPITGWQVGEWSIYEQDSVERLYFGDAVSPNTWKVTDGVLLDGEYQITSNYRSKRFEFGMPAEQKELDDFYVEGYISPNTELTISLFYDEDGFSGTSQTTLAGTETDYITEGELVNAMGLTPFGTERFGANDDLTGKKKFRVHLNKDFRRVPFYNCQVQFASSGENQQWEVIRYGFLVRPHSEPTRTKLQRAFT